MNYESGALRSNQSSPSTLAAGSPVRLSEVQEQVSRSNNVMDRVATKMKALHESLVPVLRNTSSRPQDNKSAAPKPTLVGHASALSNHNDQLEMVDEMLADILDRLEL